MHISIYKTSYKHCFLAVITAILKYKFGFPPVKIYTTVTKVVRKYQKSTTVKILL